MTTNIQWTTKDGRPVLVSVELVTSDTLNADGHQVEVARCELRIVAEVAGQTMGYGRPMPAPANQHGAVAVIGKLGITADNLAKIEGAIAAVEATPEWQANLARIQVSQQAAARYEAGRAKMRSVMGY